MIKGKLSTIANLSNEANVHSSNESHLIQYNIVSIFGMNCLNVNKDEIMKPLSIIVKKTGELEINGIDDTLLNDDNIRIYSDKKVTESEEKKL